MKAIFLIIYFLCSCNLFLSQDNFELYKKAAEYIKTDTEFLKEMSSVINDTNICVSTEIISFEKRVFLKEILGDSIYNMTDSKEINNMLDSMEFTYEKHYNKDFIKLNNDTNNCRHLIFFSDVYDNQFTAEVVSNLSMEYSSSSLANRYGTNFASYFFRFDERNNVEKVFKKIGSF
ncbi:MAG: hypothetical protein EHM58_10825 [Ignavibacteriae bacterium]|nr:MAG: hypothetical protein EHM58_10825 [Ignavibacteriota bacterium]